MSAIEIKWSLITTINVLDGGFEIETASGHFFEVRRDGPKRFAMIDPSMTRVNLKGASKEAALIDAVRVIGERYGDDWLASLKAKVKHG